MFLMESFLFDLEFLFVVFVFGNYQNVFIIFYMFLLYIDIYIMYYLKYKYS